MTLSVRDVTFEIAEEFREWIISSGVGDINHAAKNFDLLKRVLTLAVKEKYLLTNPLMMHSPPRIKKNTPPDFLTHDEIKLIMDFKFSSIQLQKCADLFIFQCFTGLSYIDLTNFCIQKHTVLDNGMIWIVMDRKKGENRIDVTYDTTELPLFPEAKQILEKYNYVLPFVRNDHYNNMLKQIAQIVGIEKRLYTHLARKTAGDRWLNAGLSYEVVAKMLGHKSIETTRKYYARVRRSRVADEIKKVIL